MWISGRIFDPYLKKWKIALLLALLLEPNKYIMLLFFILCLYSGDFIWLSFCCYYCVPCALLTQEYVWMSSHKACMWKICVFLWFCDCNGSYYISGLDASVGVMSYRWHHNNDALMRLCCVSLWSWEWFSSCWTKFVNLIRVHLLVSLTWDPYDKSFLN